jgi:hypothetical protein
MFASQSLPFRSPVLKLLRFFYRSRDQWKAKCKVAKRENKSLKTRLAKMTESRDRWKSRAQQAVMGDADGHTPLVVEPKRRPGKAMATVVTWPR